MSFGREDGGGKGSHNAQLRDMHSSINYARKMAYDHSAIEAKKCELARNQRRKLIFPHLNSLIMQRARDDVRGNALPGTVGTAYDRSWEQYFIRQGLKDQRTASAEVITKNMKRKYYSWLLPVRKERSVPSLSNLCIETISKNLNLYAPEDVQYALSTVGHEKTGQLSLLASIAGTLADEYMVCFHHELLERLYLSELITDQGFNVLLSSMQESVNSHFQALDSWENIELSDINTSTCMNLCDLTLLSSGISTASLRVLDDHCPHLHRLCVHDVQFGTESRQSDPMVFCLQVLDTLSAGFCALISLELHYCHWVRLQALTLWARRIEILRSGGVNSALKSLKYIAISGIEDYLIEHSGAQSDETNEEGEEEWEPVHPLFATAGVAPGTQQHTNIATNNSASRNKSEQIISQLRELFQAKCGVSIAVEV